MCEIFIFVCLLFPVFSNLLFVGGRVVDSEFGQFGEGGVPRKIFKILLM